MRKKLFQISKGPLRVIVVGLFFVVAVNDAKAAAKTKVGGVPVDTASSPVPAVSSGDHFRSSQGPVAEPSGRICTCPCVCPSGVPERTDLLSATLLSKDEIAKLQKEFIRSQKSELKALRNRHKVELKELKSSQAARRREWEGKARQARREYFNEHSHGPERRAYVQDLMKRREAMQDLLKSEFAQRKNEQEVRRKAIKDDQVLKLKEFKEYLKRGQRPPESLWPGKSF